ncbi:electron transporter RnfC [Pseudodesulfovibrio cashew]|uniref:Electron transporter RnfC n=1 Tax=Pseudodesulfovibrio cashew TaxID=2678688 RepID=A0A6I6JTJ6_9BACT|nr:electron transporter RnfC [Pseudodesulfovibrio cashew]QGY40984.1 electron transporter RnfC [Pseudodesulfovibrio cashew]
MSTFSFSLQTGETGPLIKASTPETVRIPTHGHTALYAKGDQVLAGTRIAKALLPDEGDLHAPLAGVIEEIESDGILIRVTGKERTAPQEPPENGGDHLREWLRQSGVDAGSLRQANTLIVNAVPPEPGISIHAPLLQDYRKVVELGLETVLRITASAKTYLVTARGNRTNAFPDCTVLDVPAVYPSGIDQLVMKAVTGREVLLGTHPEDVTILSVRDLYLIGRVMETGRPVTETVLTIGGRNHLIMIGTAVGFLLQEAGASAHPGDRVLLGGPMRGRAALNLQQGVDKEATGLTIVKQGEGLNPTDNFCLGCGECEAHCPARIMPGMISRCAEFKHFARAEDYHIHSCIECGLCAYYCKAQRPLLQYIRLAKYELALLRTKSLHPIEDIAGGEA